MTAFIAVFTITSIAFTAERRGADSAYPAIERHLSNLSLEAGKTRELSDGETAALIDLSAKEGINVFELIDCAARYAKGEKARILISGDSLRATEGRFSLGDERVLAILPIDKVLWLEIGTPVSPGQKDLDIYLDSEYESFIEIGKAHYDRRFGFERVSPLLLDGCYGVQVSRFLITTPLSKLELYAPGKGAIYVKGLSRPKKWNLQIITGKNQ